MRERETQPGPPPILVAVIVMIGAIGLGWIIFTQIRDNLVQVAALIGVGALDLALILRFMVLARIGRANPRSLTAGLELYFVLFSVGGISLWFVSLSFAGLPLSARMILVGIVAVVVVAIRFLKRPDVERSGPG